MRRPSFSRRVLLKTVAPMITLGGGQTYLANWLAGLAYAASTEAKRGRSIILLWMDGGPSTIDLWDLKRGHEHGGPFAEIATSEPGVRISEHLPRLAQRMNDLLIIRSMTSGEGDHERANYFVRSGYQPAGGIDFPSFGASMARELSTDRQHGLPPYVCIGASRHAAQLGGGFLGSAYSPFRIAEHAETTDDLQVPDLKPPAVVPIGDHRRRQELLQRVDRPFIDAHGSSPVVDSIRAAHQSATQLMQPHLANAFRLSDETEAIREQYGYTLFGQSCLLARRLIERDVPFVEVTLDGWDTHQDNFRRVTGLSQTLDRGFATLLDDLRERGLLESTIVVCLGEFGRTPRINSNQGRDHWPHAWSAVLAGGHLGGIVLGRTSNDGTVVEETPVRIPDLLSTLCHLVGVDPLKQHMSNVGRPIRITDPNATPLRELI